MYYDLLVRHFFLQRARASESKHVNSGGKIFFKEKHSKLMKEMCGKANRVDYFSLGQGTTTIKNEEQYYSTRSLKNNFKMCKARHSPSS